MKKEITTKSESETFKWAEKIGQQSKKGDVYALYGEIGTGKTIIAKGIARGMGIKEEITSPTFLLLEVYSNKIPLYHFDLYRINNHIEFNELCFEEHWNGEGISIIEWAEKAGDRLPDNSTRIKIEWIKKNQRRIIIEYTGV